ncbi:hypothetical protein HDU67_007146 [Dinochytrium kinnereticum]|nr:hypothetical protein HDU67_007146 [Dinochytrium kinnereticum]
MAGKRKSPPSFKPSPPSFKPSPPQPAPQPPLSHAPIRPATVVQTICQLIANLILIFLFAPMIYNHLLLITVPLPTDHFLTSATGDMTPATILADHYVSWTEERPVGDEKEGMRMFVSAVEGEVDSEEKDPKDWVVLLVHGYPESGLTSWSRVIPVLAKKLGMSISSGKKAGKTSGGRRRVTFLMPDLRGFNGSIGKEPRGAEVIGDAPYTPLKATDDLVELIKSQTKSGGKACVVGHDWGAVPSWNLALLHPELVSCLMILDGPHPLGYLYYGLRHPQDIATYSWYIIWDNTFGRFGMAEWLAAWRDWDWMVKWWPGTATRGTFSTAEVEEYKAIWSKPGVTSSMLAWYRNIPSLLLQLQTIYPSSVSSDSPPPGVLSKDIAAASLWGGNDAYLTPDMGNYTVDHFAPHMAFEVLDGVSHWVQHEAPGKVTDGIMELLNKATW